jgi:hypothetical protein
MSAGGWSGEKYLKCMSVWGCMHGGGRWGSRLAVGAVEWHAMIAAVSSAMALGSWIVSRRKYGSRRRGFQAFRIVR